MRSARRTPTVPGLTLAGNPSSTVLPTYGRTATSAPSRVLSC